MTPRRLTTLYIKALTATWILVIVPLTMGAYSCSAYQRRSECCSSNTVEPRGGLTGSLDLKRSRPAPLPRSMGSTQGVDGKGRAGMVSATSPRWSARNQADNVRGIPLPETSSSGIVYEITSYSHNCTLPTRGHDKVARRAANGRWPIADVTIAADPSIPFGTELLIEGLGFRTVGDRGSAIKGRKIDVFVDSCREAKEFGRQWLKVYPVPSGTTRQAGLEISNEED